MFGIQDWFYLENGLTTIAKALSIDALDIDDALRAQLIHIQNVFRIIKNTEKGSDHICGVIVDEIKGKANKLDLIKNITLEEISKLNEALRSVKTPNLTFEAILQKLETLRRKPKILTSYAATSPTPPNIEGSRAMKK